MARVDSKLPQARSKHDPFSCLSGQMQSAAFECCDSSDHNASVRIPEITADNGAFRQEDGVELGQDFCVAFQWGN